MNKEQFTWGIGIEHEMHVFHKPDNKNKKYLGENDKIQSIIVFDSESVIKRILANYKKNKVYLKKSEYDFLKGIPFELSGRTCNGKKVIEKIPIRMPELITAYPFCSVNNTRTRRAIDYIFNYKYKLIKLLKKDDIAKELIKKYGDLNQYPYGMSRYIKYGTVKNNTYIFDKDKNNNDKLYSDYTGSYHITLTLPYTSNTKQGEFIKMHKNFCNQLQWIEPLLLIGFFSGDEYSPGTKKNRIRGSFRMMNMGWGNIAGSDIRLFDEGIGRYAKKEIFWRKDVDFEGLNDLEPCIKASPYAKKEGGITSYGSDLRTFGDNEKGERISGFPMNKPNGIEIRIFDNFDSRYIKNLMMFLFLLIENSMVTTTKSYVYENKIWINEIQNIMKYGYTSKINNKYINLIEKKLNVKIKKDNNHNLYNCLFKALYNKNKDGFYYKLLTEGNHGEILKFDTLYTKSSSPLENKFMNINEEAWELAFLVKLNRNENILIKFNQFLKIIEYLNNISYEKIKELLLICIGDNWLYDTDNILILLKKFRFIQYKNINFNKNLIRVTKDIIQLNTIIINKAISNYFKKDEDEWIIPTTEINFNNLIN